MSSFADRFHKAFRPGQALAFDVAMDRLVKGETHTAIVLPTRYGKSDLMRAIALEACDQKLIAGAIAFSPFDILSSQLVNHKKILEMTSRYGLERSVAVRFRRMRSFAELTPFSNGECFLAANMQLAMRNNIGDFQKMIEFIHREAGRPPCLFIDECQFISNKKAWGEFIGLAVEYGCKLILVTATPIREDGDEIPGFRTVRISSDDESRWITKGVIEEEGELRRLVELWAGSRNLVRIDADHITTFKEAWDEVPSPLCHLSREVIDQSIYRPEQPVDWLSAQSPSESARILSRVVRDPRFMELAIRKMLEILANLKAQRPEIAAIVFTGNDLPASEEDNEHAEQVKRLVMDLWPEYLAQRPQVVIATMKNPDLDQTAHDRIEAFREGKGDILIVKQMGGLGLDCSRLKVGVDLCTSRGTGSTIQRQMRIATPHGPASIGYYITPDDPGMDRIWKGVVVEQGGERDLLQIQKWIADSLVSEKMLPIDPKDPSQRIYRLGDTKISRYDDSAGRIGDRKLYELVGDLHRLYPEVALKRTKPEVAELLSPVLLSLGVESQPEVEQISLGLDDQITRLGDDANDLAGDIAKSLMKIFLADQPYDRSVYQEKIKFVWTSAYRTCGVERGIELRQIKDLNLLAQLVGFLERWKAQLT